MTGTSPTSARWALRLVVAVAVLGWLVRLAPLVLHGRLAAPVDYDEGVYFSAAALLGRGHALYGSFVVVHPPGLFYLLAPFTFLGRPSTALFVTQAAMTLVGAVNIYLVGRIALRVASPAAAIAGALVYAFFPEAVRAEHGVFLEPVLNLLCLSAVLLRLPGDQNGRAETADRRAWAAGLLLGAATAVKLWGAFALMACLVAPGRGQRRDAWRLIGGAGIAFGALVAPVALAHPGQFFEQVVRFQLRRPPEPLPFVDRIRLILFNPTAPGAGLLDHRSLIGAAIVATAVVVLLVGGRSILLRFALPWYLLIVAAFLVSASYFAQYNAHLAPALALLGAGATDELLRGLQDIEHRLRRLTGAAAALVLCATFLVAVRGVIRDDGRHTADLTVIGEAIRAQHGVCVFSFEPQWLLAADRLPDPARFGPMTVDTYAAQLDAVVRSGRSPRDVSAALDDPASAAVVSRAVETCDAVAVGDRGRRQLGSLLPAVLQNFHRAAATSDAGPDLWLRNGS